ncbi:MAG: elongation factor G, partial [Acutalibacteraceae bacterium]
AETDDLIFETEVVGGSVPKNFFPAVEKGLRECIRKGVMAGYPMVGLKAVLYDGSYHPVDSSEMAFKTAASLAFKAAIPQANPSILEPIGTLKAYIPGDYVGDIMGDVTKRRGAVLGMGPAEDSKLTELVAEVPMAEMGDFATVLRSITAGRGSFTLEFARYQDAPANVAQKVIEEAKLEAED